MECGTIGGTKARQRPPYKGSQKQGEQSFPLSTSQQVVDMTAKTVVQWLLEYNPRIISTHD